MRPFSAPLDSPIIICLPMTARCPSLQPGHCLMNGPISARGGVAGEDVSLLGGARLNRPDPEGECCHLRDLLCAEKTCTIRILLTFRRNVIIPDLLTLRKIVAIPITSDRQLRRLWPWPQQWLMDTGILLEPLSAIPHWAPTAPCKRKSNFFHRLRILGSVGFN